MSNTNEGSAALSRRQVLSIVAAGGALGLAWKFGLPGAHKARAATATRTLMGTTLHLTVVGNDAAGCVLRQVQAQFLSYSTGAGFG